MKINGVWRSSSGSKLEIEEKQGKLTGTFHLATEHVTVAHDLSGSIDPDETPKIRPLSFSIAWRDATGKSLHSVTAYTGQLNAKGEKPNLEVIFMIAHDQTPLWKGTGISYDNFEKVD